jgi:hypothetical protein
VTVRKFWLSVSDAAKGRAPLLERDCRDGWSLAIVELAAGDFSIGIDERLPIDASNTLHTASQWTGNPWLADDEAVFGADPGKTTTRVPMLTRP